jgi:hypothetical protein
LSIEDSRTEGDDSQSTPLRGEKAVSYREKMFSVIVPRDQEPQTRRSHKKSRGGCRTCKARRMKVGFLEQGRQGVEHTVDFSSAMK